jgi:cysteine synthase A
MKLSPFEACCQGVPHTDLSDVVALGVPGGCVFAAREYFGPTLSIKDRIAGFMIANALGSGRLIPGGTVLEASSGSTAIAAASMCRQLGLNFSAVIPKGTPQEKIEKIKSLGGHVETVEGGILAARQRAQQIADNQKGVFYLDQFANPDHARAHFRTARSILQALHNPPAVCLCLGVGTGATLTGFFEYGMENGCAVLPVVARLEENASLRDFGFSPPGFENHYMKMLRENPVFAANCREVVVSEEEVIRTHHWLLVNDFPVGIASAVNVAASFKTVGLLAEEMPVLTVMTDKVDRYRSRWPIPSPIGSISGPISPIGSISSTTITTNSIGSISSTTNSIGSISSTTNSTSSMEVS